MQTLDMCKNKKVINTKLDVTNNLFGKGFGRRKKWKWHDGTSDLPPKPIFSCVSSVRTFTNVTFDKYIMNTCAHTCTETWNITVFVL